MFGVIGDALAFVLRHVGDALLDRLHREFLIQPIHVPADVGHAGVEPKGFGNIEASLLVDAESNGIGEQRLGGGEFDLETLGDAKTLEREFGLVRRGLNLRRVA